MFKLPQSIIFAVIGFNLTAFAIPLQLDIFIINWTWLKIVMWILSAGAWWLTWSRRKKYFVLF